LLGDKQADEFGFPLQGEPGWLVAFDSHLFHEVKPITHEERYSVMTWLYGLGSASEVES
jgi:SM-20-related protein